MQLNTSEYITEILPIPVYNDDIAKLNRIIHCNKSKRAMNVLNFYSSTKTNIVVERLKTPIYHQPGRKPNDAVNPMPTGPVHAIRPRSRTEHLHYPTHLLRNLHRHCPDQEGVPPWHLYTLEHPHSCSPLPQA